MDDALAAYDAGHADGLAGHTDSGRAVDPDTGPDYRAGVVDGRPNTIVDYIDVWASPVGNAFAYCDQVG